MDDLPKKSYSLAEFCETAKTLLIDDEDAASFVRFVLCGIYQDHQAVIDAIQNRLDDSHNIQGLRDFDSLLGIHRDIVVSQTSLTLFPIAKKEDTLKTNIHLTYSFVIPNVSYRSLIQENFLPLNPFLDSQYCSSPQNPQHLHCKMVRSKYDPGSLPCSLQR